MGLHGCCVSERERLFEVRSYVAYRDSGVKIHVIHGCSDFVCVSECDILNFSFRRTSALRSSFDLARHAQQC